MERPKKQKEQCELNFLLSIWCIFFFRSATFATLGFFLLASFFIRLYILTCLVPKTREESMLFDI